MKNERRNGMRWFSAMPALCFAVLLGGCGGAGEGAASTVEVGGSSTVYPITEAVAEEFLLSTRGEVRATVGVSGTGGGFQRFCAGEIAIVNASRPIEPIERERCERAGIQPIEIVIASGGIAIVTHPENDFVQCLTMAELREIWRPRSTVETWSDIRPQWPNVEIHLYGPGTSSGTFDFFTLTVMGEEDASRADYTASERDDVLVQGVSGDEQSLGYFGYAYYAENADELNLIAVDEGEGCVRPTPETIRTGEYPLARPLYIYVARDKLQRPTVRRFVEFYLETASKLVPLVGYIPLTDEEYEAALERIEQAAGAPAA